MLPAFAALLFAAQPVPKDYVVLQCPWVPVFFESGTTNLDAAAEQFLDRFLWYRGQEGGEDTRILLRAYTSGEPASDVPRLSEARTTAVRAALIERHVPPDHIMVSHTYGRAPGMVREGWVGGWIYPEYYVPEAFRERLFPPGGPVC
jgi:hypothetical protein